MDASDSQLMSAIVNGDEVAFRTFFERHSLGVMKTLFRILREPADAEDVMQETFLQLWSRSSQYDAAKASPAGYLTLIARSRALDLVRKRKPGQGADSVEPSFEFDPSLGLIQDESRVKMRAAMSSLPAEQRQVIRLAFMAGLTHEQIAFQLNVPLGTVKTRIRLGLRRLKTMLPDGSGGGDAPDAGGGLAPAEPTDEGF